ncbi:MAG TPA: DinB family protein [Chthonomonadaceae bacterium]|nr:DinB family protein [Chthonomonadaceae bacterium]
MPQTIQALAAELTHFAAETIMVLVQNTPPDKWDWKPLDNGRTILNQMAECALANQKWADILRRRAWVSYGEEAWQQAFSELNTLDKAAARLQETTANLVEAILALPDEEMDGLVQTPNGPYSLPRCCMHAYWNMVYHEGQINYIQTLYGDFEEYEVEA